MKDRVAAAYIAKLREAWQEEVRGKNGPAAGRLDVALRSVLRTDSFDDIERDAILEALRESNNSRDAAALSLGIKPRTLYKMCKRLNLWEAIDKQADRLGLPRKAPGCPRA